jgi:MFS family permease
LFLAPLSELYGRFVVYNVANVLFIAGIVLTALSQNIGLLIFVRFLTGCAVASNVLNPAKPSSKIESRRSRINDGLQEGEKRTICPGSLAYTRGAERDLCDNVSAFVELRDIWLAEDVE